MDDRFVGPTNEIVFVLFDNVENIHLVYQIVHQELQTGTVYKQTKKKNEIESDEHEIEIQLIYHLYGIFIKDFIGCYVICICLLQ